MVDLSKLKKSQNKIFTPESQSQMEKVGNKVHKINIAVVGNSNVGKSTLIEYWLSVKPLFHRDNSNSISYSRISPNIRPIFSNTYSKIFWKSDEPIQINISKISPTSNDTSKIFHAILYLYRYETPAEATEQMLDEWIKKMENCISNHTYQIIVGTTGKTLEEIETNNFNKKKYHEQKINCSEQSLQPSMALATFLDEITISAYSAMINEKINASQNSIKLIDAAPVKYQSFIDFNGKEHSYIPNSGLTNFIHDKYPEKTNNIYTSIYGNFGNKYSNQ